MSTTLVNVACVALGPRETARGVLIEGDPGSGKSSLALALIDRGAALIGDDGVALEERDGRLLASSPAATAGLIEVRNIGLVRLPTTSAPLSLVIRLDREAPRFIEHAAQVTVAGHTLPAVALWPDSPALPLRAEFALERYGLT
jgi:serine kinase of HPr protein (carbohydrate metabolism regulator)